MSTVASRTANLRDFRTRNQSFDGLTGYFAFFEYGSYNLVGAGEPVRLVGVPVADDFLDVLGVSPRLGRNFDQEEGRWGGPRAVILSDSLWARQFGRDPDVIDTTITLNNEPTEVVGVLPASFDFASLFAPHTRVDFLTTFAISDETDQWGNTLAIVGRLAPGATIASAQADLDRIIAGLEVEDPDRQGLGAVVTDLRASISGPVRASLLLLATAAAAMMLIVCVNLSSLLLAKGTKRSADLAVRSALGASRTRLVRQMLLESLILAGIGAGIGIVVALGATRFVAGAEGLDIPLLRSVSVDGSVLLFSSLPRPPRGPAGRARTGDPGVAWCRGDDAAKRRTRCQCLTTQSSTP